MFDYSDIRQPWVPGELHIIVSGICNVTECALPCESWATQFFHDSGSGRQTWGKWLYVWGSLLQALASVLLLPFEEGKIGWLYLGLSAFVLAWFTCTEFFNIHTQLILNIHLVLDVWTYWMGVFYHLIYLALEGGENDAVIHISGKAGENSIEDKFINIWLFKSNCE